jgi:hypothetical protein
MKPSRAGSRRHLATSPFNAPASAPPELFAIRDQVTHDKYGLGVVLSVEGDLALVVDFGIQRVRLAIPCAKLTKL